MTIRRFLLALLLLVPSARADFTFIHCSDVHYGAGENHVTDAELYREMTQLNPKPKFLVTTGDICEYGTDAEYELYRETIKNLGDIKDYPTTGNHDVRWNPRGKEGFVLGTKHPLHQSWDYENIHFVNLDATVLLEHWGHIPQDQLNWLKQDLEKVGTEKPVIIAFHHWIGRDSVSVDNEQKLLDLVKPYNVVLWLQGHGHSDIQWNVNGTPAIMQAGLYQGSYCTMAVSATEIKVRRRAWRKPENKGELVRDKSVPEEREVSWTDVMTVPLKKAPAPEWHAAARIENGELQLAAKAPPGAKLDYRIDTEKPQPLEGVVFKADELTPGEHVITVQATFEDGRAFQKPLPIKVPGKVAPKWDINIGGEVQSRLVRAGETLFVSSMGGELFALSPNDGSEKFRFKTGGPIFSPCHVDGDTAYFASADHFIYAMDAKTGKQIWKTETGGAVLAGPNIAQGIVCVGSTDTKIYGLDAKTGEVRWTVPGKNMFQSKTATDGERFFVGGWDNHFRCIDAKTGELKWDLELGRKQRYENFSAFSPAIVAPAVGDGMVYVSTNDGILHGLKIEDGSEVWQIDWKNMGYTSPLYHEGRVYCGLSDKGKVFCVDAKTGDFKWTAEVGSVIYDSSFCFGGPNVFIGCVNGIFSAINAESGKIDYQYRMGPGHLLGSPIADEQSVYMGSMSGQVIALPLTAGQTATAAKN